MMKKAEMLENYEKNLSNAVRGKFYVHYAADFLMHTTSFDKEGIERYMDRLRSTGMRPGTVNFVFRIIRRLFAVNNMTWDYRKGEAPDIKQRDEYRPQLSPEIIKMMIDAAKTGKLNPDEACFLALSTTYGLRCQEMANLKTGDLQLNNKSIYIATLKSGRERYHLVPPEIDRYLAGHNFEESVSVGTLSHMFKKVIVRSGAGQLKSERIGWHSIRRAVWDGGIRNGVSSVAMIKFMRWKVSSGDMAMPMRYFGNTVVGLKEQKPMLEEAQGDKEVFEKHPFLPFWRE